MGDERTKEEILSDLYAIRAAMSLVSQKTDVTRNEKYKIRESKRKIAQIDSSIEVDLNYSVKRVEKDYGIKTRLKEIEGRISFLQQEIAKKEEPIIKEKESKLSMQKYIDEKYSKNSPLIKCFIISAIIFSLIMSLLVFKLACGLPYSKAFLCGILSGGVFALVSTAIYSGKRKRDKESDSRYWSEKY